MDPTARFARVVQGPDVPLDEAAFLIAAHAHPGLDLIGQLARLDELAASCPAPTWERLLRHLFVDEGFRGDAEHYYEPENSYLDSVLDRRLGIPITLSVVAIEVGRRLGLDVRGVGLPGHFLVSCDGVLADPFGGGRLVSMNDAAELYHRSTGRADPFDPSWLAPVPTLAIVFRMLTNLKALFVRAGDTDALRWCVRLRTLIPGAPPGEARELARLMARFN